MVEPGNVAEKRAEILNDMCDLGKMYLDDGDIEQSLYWLNLAASLGNDRASSFLDDIYYYNFDAPRYTPRALEYLTGNWSNKFVLNVHSHAKKNYQSDGKEAIHYLTESANNGDDWARFALGCMYLYGRGVNKDVFKAACWFAGTDELYRFNVNALFDLAEKYRTGDGIDKDVEVAVEWYKEIIAYDAFHDRALLALAEIYFCGGDVERDVGAAIDLYRRAADCGNLTATYKLAEIYLNGALVEQNLEVAQHYLNKVIHGLQKV